MNPAERWFGTGLDGFRRMFEVWGEDEPKPVAHVPMRRAATRPLAQFVDGSTVEAVLSSSARPRRVVDPRSLWASQHGVTWSGVDYYLNQPRYRRTAWTWADQWSRINREVVVWVGPDGPQLLSGHHRTTVALLRGEPVDVVWIDPAEAELSPKLEESDPLRGVRFTPLLWSGDCPHPYVHTESGADAGQVILSDLHVTVKTTGQALEALIHTGVEPRWADSVVAFATTGKLTGAVVDDGQGQIGSQSEGGSR